MDMQNLTSSTNKPSQEASKEDPIVIPKENQDPNLNGKNQITVSDEPQSSKQTNRKESGSQNADQLEPGK